MKDPGGWHDRRGGASRAAWSDLAGGPACPASFTALAVADVCTLSGGQVVDAIACSEKVASFALGVQARLMARLAVPFVAGDPMRLAARLARRSGLDGGDDYEANVTAMVPEAAASLAASEVAAASLAASEVAAALRIAPVTAGIRVREAVHLTEEFTPAREALETGVIDRGKLRALVDQVQVLPAEQVGPVLDQVLPEVVDRCTSEIREIAAQAVITANPDAAADRHRQAAARREVKVTPGTVAMATLKAFLPADGVVEIFQVSDLLATGTAGVPGDDRGIGARRADALIDLADRLLTDGCIDLTGYIGRPLPDHGHPGRRRDNDLCTDQTRGGDPDPSADSDPDTSATDPVNNAGRADTTGPVTLTGVATPAGAADIGTAQQPDLGPAPTDARTGHVCDPAASPADAAGDVVEVRSPAGIAPADPTPTTQPGATIADPGDSDPGTDGRGVVVDPDTIATASPAGADPAGECPRPRPPAPPMPVG